MATRPSKHVHGLVKETAISMAHELYNTLMMDNVWYSAWKKKNPGIGPKALEACFVAKNLSKLVPQARAALAGMLQTTSDPELQDTIYNALLLDNTLLRGRGIASNVH